MLTASQKIKLWSGLGLVLGLFLFQDSSVSASSIDLEMVAKKVKVGMISYSPKKTVHLETAETVETVEIVEPLVYSPNTYPVGQCTWGAKELAPWAGNQWGNGGDWAASAAAAGHTVSQVPVVGAIMVWTDGGYGHVAVVTEVAADGSIQVSESNYAGNMSIGNYRGSFDPASESASAAISFIYPKN